MYEQIHSMVQERVEKIYPEMDYTIVPLSSEDSYIYRIYNENPKYELSQLSSHLLIHAANQVIAKCD